MFRNAVKAETAGIEANVGVEAVGTVGSSADVAVGTSAVDVRAQDSQMVQKRDVQAFDVQEWDCDDSSGRKYGDGTE